MNAHVEERAAALAALPQIALPGDGRALADRLLDAVVFFGGGCCTYESVKIGDMKTLARIFSSRENFSLSDTPLSLPSSSFFPFDHQVHGYTVTYGNAMECDRFGFGTEFRDV